VSFEFANITINQALTFKLAALGSVFTSGTALQAAFQNVSELFLAVKQNGEFR
jgi:D-alanyl-lipoteichoic acid acyltransferase DltB (MBOAT superfamily)